MSKLNISSDIFQNVFVKNNTIDLSTITHLGHDNIYESNSDFVSLDYIKEYVKLSLHHISDKINSTASCSNNNNIQNSTDPSNSNQCTDLKQTYKPGRIGPKHVLFDLSTLVGQITIDQATNTIISSSGFSTVKANSWVFSGKWQYEVLLTTKGVMQLGWASINCKFSAEKGVGDTIHSYAVDGNRVKKWNLTSGDYGEPWQIGDVIGVCIDLNLCTVTFYRNGKCLGVAFNKISVGTGIVYFPAISLAYNERVIVNFGARLFRYPIDDYNGLEIINTQDVLKCNLLIEWLFNLVLIETKNDTKLSKSLTKKSKDENYDFMFEKNSKESILNSNYEISLNFADNIINNFKQISLHNSFGRASTYLLASIILEELEPLIIYQYTVEACLLKHLLVFHNKNEIHCLLDIFWTLMENNSIHELLNCTIFAIVQGYHFSIISDEEIMFSELNSNSSFATFNYSDVKKSINFAHQKQYLLLFLSLIQHNKTRTEFLTNILFKRNNLVQLLNIKPIFDDKILKEKIFTKLSLNDVILHFRKKTLNKTEYFDKTWRNDELENAISELESLQNMILDTLIFQDEDCRITFVEKLSKFIIENEKQFNNLNTRSSSGQIFGTPLSILVSLFHRLSSLIRNQYENVIDHLPINLFLCSNTCSKNITRIGGLINHLNKVHGKEVLNYNVDFEKIKNNPLLEHVYMLIDGLVKLYSIGVHKQLGKYNGIKEFMLEFSQSINNLENLEGNLKEFENNFVNNQDFKSGNRRKAFEFSNQILSEEYLIRARQFAIINTTVFTANKRQDLLWLLRILLKTLENASNCGCLFSYLPDYYLETCLNLCFALRFYFGNEINHKFEYQIDHDILPINKKQKDEYLDIMKQFCTFITVAFCDERIVNTDYKDMISQSLASIITSKESLAILENVSIENRLNLIKKLTQPYENRAWAHSNWILLRFWKGNGFAYRNSESHSLVSNMFSDFNISSLNKNDIVSNFSSAKPLPSIIFQKLLDDYFNSNQKNAHLFLTSLLFQLNWSFSEFVGMLQEIQNFSSRPEKYLVDSRQLKICCTCFELSLALLRVLEMVIHYNPLFILNINSTENIQHIDINNLYNTVSVEQNVYSRRHVRSLLSSQTEDCYVSADKESIFRDNEILLQQLCSMINQILNRITMSSNCFQFMRQLSNLGTINEFSILSAVCGILVELIVKSDALRSLTLNFLINDASFQLSSYLYLTGRQMPKLNQVSKIQSASSISKKNECNFLNHNTNENIVFDLSNYKDEISDEELNLVSKLLIYISKNNERNEKIKLLDDVCDDDLCTICYANKKTALFIPCKHQSCKSCITMHFLRNQECFFCKTILEKVQFLDSNKIIYPNKEQKLF